MQVGGRSGKVMGSYMGGLLSSAVQGGGCLLATGQAR